MRQTRLWPQVYDLCHTFAHCTLDSRMAIGFFISSTCKNMLQNLIPLATA